MGIKTCLLVALASLAILKASGQETTPSSNADSLSNRTSYALWLDAGFYPFGSHTHAGGFGPTSSIRFGLGKGFGRIQFYGFVELTDYTFDPPAATSYYALSGKRRDIALYASGIAFDLFFVGAGIYNTHQDNIVTHYRDGQGTIAGESGVKSHYAFYYLLALQYQVELSTHLAVPIGLYYRDQENPSSTFFGYQASLRIGILYRL